MSKVLGREARTGNYEARTMSPFIQLLGTLYGQHRGRISLTYGLVLLEQALDLLYPFTTGLAINDLLRGSFAGLWIFIAQYVAHMIVSTARQMYDTRTYTGIYAQLAADTVLEQQRRHAELSHVVARSGMLYEYVEFFQTDIPYMMQSVFAVVGALVMLCFYDPPLAGIALLVFAPLLLINRAYVRLADRLNRGYNNQLEHEVRAIETAKPVRIRKHYRRLAFWQIRLSDAEARNYGAVHVFMLALYALAIYRSVGVAKLEAGDIFAVLSYTWNFVEGLDLVPALVQKVSRLRDISARLQPARGSDEGDV